MPQDLRIHLKFYDAHGFTTFHFYYPHAPNHIPRIGDAARPTGHGEVFHPPTSRTKFKKAKQWARDQWGCEIVKEGKEWVFRNIPNVEGEGNIALRELKSRASLRDAIHCKFALIMGGNDNAE